MRRRWCVWYVDRVNRDARLTLGLFSVLVPFGLAACGGSKGATSTTTTSGTGGSSSSTASAGGGSSSSSSSTGGGTGTGGGSSGPCGSPEPIAQWTDAPGACPAGAHQVDISSAADLASAARGQDAFANDAADTCYFIHNGTYSTTGVVFYVLKGGVPGGARRTFVGESRAGVVIHGRGTIEDDVSDVTVQNLTFDLTGYTQSGSFNTLGIGSSPTGTGKNITIDHVTFTGDCATGANGGHIEINSGDGVLVEACLIEKFGRCGPDGHQDHGVYLANGKNLTFRNNLIRGNASRGIQMYTNGGDYGTLDGLTVEGNRITANGHEDYEDGMVINSSGTGTISDVVIRRNVFDHNYYSGIRFVGGVESAITVECNTFDGNGAGSTSASRSEINIDSAGGGSGTSILKNVFSIGNTLINDCYDGASLGFSIGDNFVHGTVPAGTKASCVTGTQTMGDPQFTDAAQGDYHTMNPAASAYGAYAP